MDKRWRTRKGLTEEKLLAELEINAQKTERIRQIKKKKICGALRHLRAWGDDRFQQLQ